MRRCSLGGWALMAAGGLLAGELLLRARHRRAAVQAEEAGLRPETRQLQPARLAGRLRIVALGDSITHGMDLPAQQAYPALLEARLRAAFPERRPLVINAGVCGHTAVQGALRVERDVLRFRPALTLIAFGLNDAALGRNAWDVRRASEFAPPGVAGALSRLHLYRTLRARWRRWRQREETGASAYWPDRPRTEPAVFCMALKELVRCVRRSGGRAFLLTTHPADLRGGAGVNAEQASLIARYNALIRQAAHETGAGLIDVERAWAGRDMAPLLEWDGVHLTPAGQRALATIIAEHVIAELQNPR